MQITLFKIKNNFKKKNPELSPSFYWKLIVGVAFVLILVSFTFGYYVFNEMQKEADLSAGNFTKRPPVRKERLERVIEYFSGREKKSIQILNSPTPVVDPSI